MDRFRPHVIVLIVIAVVVLAIVFSRGIDLRLEWGASGFVAGLLCGALLMMEIHHRRKHPEESHR